MDGSAAPNLKVRSGRRWLPWKSRTRSITSRAWDWVPDWGTNLGDGPISSVLGALLFIFTFPFMVPALLVTPFFVLESLLQWVVFPFVLLLRVMGVLPVVAWVQVGQYAPYEEQVRGWRRAKIRTAELKAAAAANPSMTMDSAVATSHSDDPYQYDPR